MTPNANEPNIAAVSPTTEPVRLAPPVGTPFMAPSSSSRMAAQPSTQAWPPAAQPVVQLVRPAGSRPRLVGGEAFLMEASAGPVQWWWEGIFPATGITFLAGDPMSLKTVMALVLSVVSRMGGIVAGRAVSPARIIYLMLEHLDGTNQNTLNRAKKTYQPPDIDNFHVLRDFTLDSEDAINGVIEWAEDVDAGIIIVDSLRRAHSGEENSSQEAAEIMRRLQRLTCGGTRAVIVIHHLTRGTKNLRGSTDYSAGADAEVIASRSGTNLKLQVKSHAAADTEVHLRVEFTEDAVTIQGADGAAEADAAFDERRLRDAVIRACTPGPMGKGALRSAARAIHGPVGHDPIDAMALRLEGEGLLRHGEGRGACWMAVLPAGGPLLTTPPPAPTAPSRRRRRS